MWTETRALRTDVRDLRKTEYKLRGMRDWGHAEVKSSALFIVEGFENTIEHETPCMLVAANIFDALEARARFEVVEGDIYLLAKRPGKREKGIIFGRIEEAVGSTEVSDVFIMLEGGTSFLMDALKPRAGDAKVRPAKRLYASQHRKASSETGV